MVKTSGKELNTVDRPTTDPRVVVAVAMKPHHDIKSVSSVAQKLLRYRQKAISLTRAFVYYKIVLGVAFDARLSNFDGKGMLKHRTDLSFPSLHAAADEIFSVHKQMSIVLPRL